MYYNAVVYVSLVVQRDMTCLDYFGIERTCHLPFPAPNRHASDFVQLWQENLCSGALASVGKEMSCFYSKGPAPEGKSSLQYWMVADVGGSPNIRLCLRLCVILPLTQLVDTKLVFIHSYTFSAFQFIVIWTAITNAVPHQLLPTVKWRWHWWYRHLLWQRSYHYYHHWCRRYLHPWQ